MIKNLIPALCLILIAAFCSCKHRQSQQPGISAHGTGKMNFALLRYDSAELEYRLDSIHNRGLVLQFCLSNAGNNNSNFQLISYAYDTLSDFNNSWIPDTLRVVSDSLPRNFEGKLILGNNEVTREQLYDVLNKPDGKRVSYDYMLFTPVVEGVFHHVVYMIRPIKNGKPAEGTNGRMQMTSPRPPTRIWND